MPTCTSFDRQPTRHVSLSVKARVEDAELGVRCRIATFTFEGVFAVDGEAVFSLREPPSSISPDIQRDFVERVGMMVLYPYLRSAAAGCAAQMCLQAPNFPLLRPGDLTLTPESPKEFGDEPPF